MDLLLYWKSVVRRLYAGFDSRLEVFNLFVALRMLSLYQVGLQECFIKSITNVNAILGSCSGYQGILKVVVSALKHSPVKFSGPLFSYQ